MNDIITINGVECYEKNGVAYLRLETVARGLGFTQVQTKNGVDYTSVRWERVEGYLAEIGFPHKWGKDDYIPENIFYRLAMKAKNETAERFQAKIADEVLPSLRRRGFYSEGDSEDMIVAQAMQILDRRVKALELINSTLTVQNQIMQPKADYFDELVDRNLNTGIRETAKEYGIGQKNLVDFLLEHKYVYRDKKGKLQPYAAALNDGLFVLKECFNEKTNWAGTQLLITPKGRETFRLLCVGA